MVAWVVFLGQDVLGILTYDGSSLHSAINYATLLVATLSLYPLEHARGRKNVARYMSGYLVLLFTVQISACLALGDVGVSGVWSALCGSCLHCWVSSIAPRDSREHKDDGLAEDLLASGSPEQGGDAEPSGSQGASSVREAAAASTSAPAPVQNAGMGGRRSRRLRRAANVAVLAASATYLGVCVYYFITVPLETTAFHLLAYGLGYCYSALTKPACDYLGQ